MQWTWSWVPFAGGTSFGDNPFFDWIRVICLIAGVIVFFAIGRVLVESKRRIEPIPRTQRAILISLGLAVIYICFTEFAVFGTPATPRLLVGLVTLVTGIYGVRGIRRKQRAVAHKE